jgi:hypothetical protein
MTKVQAIAKAVLTSLGIMAVVSFNYRVPVMGPGAPLAWLRTLIGWAQLVFVMSTVYVLILKNASLVRALVPKDSDDIPASSQWCEAVMRAAMVLCGLLLFMDTLQYLLQAMGFLVLPTGLRQFMQDTVVTGFARTLSSWMDFRAQYTLWKTLLALASVYLLGGAPHFVRWLNRAQPGDTAIQKTSGDES